MPSKNETLRLHEPISRWIKCKCGKMVPANNYGKHFLEELKKEGHEQIKQAMYSANDPNASWNNPK